MDTRDPLIHGLTLEDAVQNFIASFDKETTTCKVCGLVYRLSDEAREDYKLAGYENKEDTCMPCNKKEKNTDINLLAMYYGTTMDDIYNKDVEIQDGRLDFQINFSQEKKSTLIEYNGEMYEPEDIAEEELLICMGQLKNNQITYARIKEYMESLYKQLNMDKKFYFPKKEAKEIELTSKQIKLMKDVKIKNQQIKLF